MANQKMIRNKLKGKTQMNFAMEQWLKNDPHLNKNGPRALSSKEKTKIPNTYFCSVIDQIKKDRDDSQ